MEIICHDSKEGWVVLAVSGRLDAQTAPQLEEACRSAMASSEANLAIDLGEVPYMSSAGLRVAISLLKQIGSRRRMALVRPQSPVREVLEMSGFSLLLPVVDTIDDLD